MIDLSQLPFTQKMQIKEAHIRGLYISIACDYERLMDDVIILCELDKALNIAAYKSRYIIHLEMGKKFRRAKDGLKKVYPIHFDSFLPHLDVIEKLVKYRTILAHGYSDYDEKGDTSYILFEYHDKGKLKIERIEIEPFLRELSAYQKSIMELAGLTVYIRKEKDLL